MLIQFQVSNYRSIRVEQELNMLAGAGKELPGNACVSDFDANTRLLRAAVVYGPNASGKSNLIKALKFMREFVLECSKRQQGDKIPTESFSLDQTKPSKFVILFNKESVRYEYGFIINTEQVIEEWLFAYPLGRKQEWFYRQYDETKSDYHWKMSTHFNSGEKSKENELLKSTTRSNELFLSHAIQLNNDQLKPIFDWFKEELMVILPDGNKYMDNQKSLNMFESDNAKLIQFMKTADHNIKNIEIENLFSDNKELEMSKKIGKFSSDYFFKDMFDKIIQRKKILVARSGFSMDFQYESDGTKKWFSLAGHWLELLEKGGVLVVDELENSLHPLLVKSLISWICDPKINKKNAQLIFSTHSTSLLDNELLRRDQIYFVEKDEENATNLYSLVEFSPRQKENFEKGYLQGRYGALPYIGEWKF